MSVIYLLVFIQTDKSKNGTFTKNYLIKISEAMNHYSLGGASIPLECTYELFLKYNPYLCILPHIFSDRLP